MFDIQDKVHDSRVAIAASATASVSKSNHYFTWRALTVCMAMRQPVSNVKLKYSLHDCNPFERAVKYLCYVGIALRHFCLCGGFEELKWHGLAGMRLLYTTLVVEHRVIVVYMLQLSPTTVSSSTTCITKLTALAMKHFLPSDYDMVTFFTPLNFEHSKWCESPSINLNFCTFLCTSLSPWSYKIFWYIGDNLI